MSNLNKVKKEHITLPSLLVFSKDGKKVGHEHVFDNEVYIKDKLEVSKDLDGIAVLINWDKKKVRGIR